MKAIVKNKKKSTEKLMYSDIEKPLPGESDVLLKIVSVSLNAADYRAMKMGMNPKKKAFGSGIAGKVESIGKNIKGFAPGDEVIGDLSDDGFGGLAEYAVAPEKALVRKPANISFEEAATLPVAATTALKALRDKGEIRQGQKVLIVGSAGGVGTFAVQMARYFEAKVSAVCSTRNVKQSSALGADIVIDYTKQDFTISKDRYDLILAINGTYSLLAYKRLLSEQGIFVMVGGSMAQIFKSIFFGWLLSLGSKKMRFLSAKSDPKALEDTAKLLEEGKIKALIEKRYTLENAAEAMEYLGEGHAKSKVVINVG